MEFVRAGVCGMGFMGTQHARAYRAAAAAGLPVRLTGVADHHPERLARPDAARGNLDVDAGPAIDPAETSVFASAEELIASGLCDLVSVCTPTDSHIEVALAAVRAGLHVLVEKPVALAPAPIRSLGEAAAAAGVLAMPAMCMRFWPGWTWLKEAVERGGHGRVLSARFERVAPPPAWSPAFYLDERRSGGPLFDLHIHDVDFIVHLFGRPEAVRTVGDRRRATTSYLYGGDGPRHVVAEGGWSAAPGAPFRMRYLVEFEAGVAEFDIARDAPLVFHGHGGETETIDVAGSTGYDGEVRAMVDAAASGAGTPATMEEAAAVIELLHAEVESMRTRRSVSFG